MAPTTTSRTLRIITLISIIPAFALLLAAGIVSFHVDDDYYYWHPSPKPLACFCSIIPLFISLVSGIGSLWLSSRIRALVWTLLDLMAGLGYLGVLLPIWIQEPRRLDRHANYMMLETYGTCFLILNMSIHAFFLGRALMVRPKRCIVCGHEQDPLPAMTTKKSGKGALYSLLGENDYLDEPDEDVRAAGPSEPRASEAKESEDA